MLEAAQEARAGWVQDFPNPKAKVVPGYGRSPVSPGQCVILCVYKTIGFTV